MKPDKWIKYLERHSKQNYYFLFVYTNLITTSVAQLCAMRAQEEEIPGIPVEQILKMILFRLCLVWMFYVLTRSEFHCFSAHLFDDDSSLRFKYLRRHKYVSSLSNMIMMYLSVLVYLNYTEDRPRLLHGIPLMPCHPGPLVNRDVLPSYSPLSIVTLL